MSKLVRSQNPQLGQSAPTFAVALAVDDSATIDVSQYASMRFRRASGSVATLTWHESDTPSGPWVPCRVDGVALTQSVGDYWDNLNFGAMGALFLRATATTDPGTIAVVRKG